LVGTERANHLKVDVWRRFLWQVDWDDLQHLQVSYLYSYREMTMIRSNQFLALKFVSRTNSVYTRIVLPFNGPTWTTYPLHALSPNKILFFLRPSSSVSRSLVYQEKVSAVPAGGGATSLLLPFEDDIVGW